MWRVAVALALAVAASSAHPLAPVAARAGWASPTAAGVGLETASPAALRLGVVLCPSQSAEAALQSGFVDELLLRLTAPGDPVAIEVTLLSPASAIVRSSGADLVPVIADPPESADRTALAQLPEALDLDEVIILQLSPQGANEGLRAHGLWARRGQTELRRMNVEIAGGGAPSAAVSVERVIRAGFGAAPSAGETGVSAAAPVPGASLAGEPSTGVAPSGSGGLAVPASGTVTPTSGAPEQAPPVGEPSRPKPDPGSEPAAGEFAQAEEAILRGQYELALRLTDAAVAQGADALAAVRLRARIYQFMGAEGLARQELERALAINPNLVDVIVQLAGMEAARGLWQRAVELCREAISRDARYAPAYTRLYELYQRQGQPRRALEALEQGAAAIPGDADLSLRLGRVYMQRGIYAAAQGALERAAATGDGKQRREALERLGDLYTRMGAYGPAFASYIAASRTADPGAQIEAGAYARIFGAADEAIANVVDRAWTAFISFVEGGGVARADAHKATAAAVEQLDEITAAAASVPPPEALRATHAQRELYYQVSREALYNALLYLDTGDSDLLNNARARKTQAEAERERIPAPPQSPRAADYQHGTLPRSVPHR